MIKKLFKFRRIKLFKNWVTIYLFEANGKRWEIGFVLDESEGVGNPLVAISFFFISICIMRPDDEEIAFQTNQDEIDYYK